MSAFRYLQRTATRPALNTSSFLPSTRLSSPPTTRALSLLSPRRPMIPISSILPSIPGPTTTTLPATETLDLLPKISSHPAIGGAMQVRCGPRNTYSPSHFVRKRRHGFLSRLRTKNGRKTLMRRIKKGRHSLSH
ncbi:hypothetical protein M011DRAFT_484879 [Sporormia fimetaria CBS 119925]|uniref:Large ribosomal subunit protein bL34m n=1 Tax=Sporormia fimetaria CBS 119925 TaxID=1340428 RepID=A0A6A6VFS8_9PLEO|nr:hypothetical protein M011DRAFT_484879 [Sporormia fimetaria CBS 119925]